MAKYTGKKLVAIVLSMGMVASAPAFVIGTAVALLTTHWLAGVCSAILVFGYCLDVLYKELVKL